MRVDVEIRQCFFYAFPALKDRWRYTNDVRWVNSAKECLGGGVVLSVER